jgi:hypothetical protein
MSIADALAQINAFKGKSLALTVDSLETALVDVNLEQARTVLEAFSISSSLMTAAAAVKQASAQIDVVIHAIGIACSLPYLLAEDEEIESTSLGAGNAHSDFDLVTNKRIAEFKFVNWQGGSESIRKKTLFADYVKLASDPTHKAKYLYLLRTDIPLKFLRGRSNVYRILDKNNRMREHFQSNFGDQYETVGDFYRDYADKIQLVSLPDIVPALNVLTNIIEPSEDTSL